MVILFLGYHITILPWFFHAIWWNVHVWCTFSHVQFCNPMDHQSLLSMGFSRQEYWSGLPCPSPGHPPDPGTEPASLAGRFFITVSPEWFKALFTEILIFQQAGNKMLFFLLSRRWHYSTRFWFILLVLNWEDVHVPGKFHRHSSLMGYIHAWGRKELGWTHIHTHA